MAYVPTKPPKVFVDSSVFIAAAISPTGSARQLVLRGLRSEIEMVTSELVYQETERNLERKAPEAVASFQLFRERVPGKAVKVTKALVLEA